MSQTTSTAEWDGVADAYEEVNEPFMGLFVDRALALVPLDPTHEALDVAAGPGTVAARVAPHVRRVLATDFAPGMVAALRRRVARDGLRNVDVAQMDGQHLDLPDQRFDHAFSAFGLIFFPDRGRGFAELFRVLRPGGHAVVLGWGAVDRSPLFPRMVQLIRECAPELPKPPEGQLPPLMSLSDPDRFRQEMTAAGFDVDIHTVTCTRTVGPDVESFWRDARRSNALIAAARRAIGEVRFAELERRVVDGLRVTLGDGPVEMTADAHIGIGMRP